MLKQGIRQHQSGIILCPNSICGQKIGQFNNSGLKCNCGQSVQPGFQVFKSKVKAVYNFGHQKNAGHKPITYPNSQLSTSFYKN
jgi:hypothetical protein